MITREAADQIRAARGRILASLLADRHNISRAYVYAIWQGERSPGERPRGRPGKLSPEQRQAIMISTLPYSLLAERYGISEARVSQIRREHGKA